jgi:multidrug efflux pump subunit AcrB
VAGGAPAALAARGETADDGIAARTPEPRNARSDLVWIVFPGSKFGDTPHRLPNDGDLDKIKARGQGLLELIGGEPELASCTCRVATERYGGSRVGRASAPCPQCPTGLSARARAASPLLLTSAEMLNQIVLIALRRPYTFVVMAILIVLFGALTILHMPTDALPNMRVPVTSVVWIYSGMLPQQVEGRITYLFERALTSTVEGIKYIHSNSYYGSSITNIYLQDGVDVARAEADIVGIAQNVVKALPPNISPPMVMRLAPSSIPVAMLEVSSDRMTPAELYNLAYMRIRPLLVTVPGIVLPHPYGGQDMQVMVNLDQQKLLARHLTPKDVHDVLMRQYRVLPTGDIKIMSTDWIVQTNASPLDIDDFDGIPIKREGNAFVYLRDVATVRLMGRVQQNAVLLNGKQIVIIVAMKSTDASTVDVVEGIKKMIRRAEQVVPEGVEIRLLDDASTFVEDAISDVVYEMLTAGALVGAIVLLLLGSWRATVIVRTSIPLSILTAIIGLHRLGETINVMTLGGLALAVGILVDDATVMIENIDRHLQMGKPLEQAIVDAANQIVVPTFVATLCIAIAWFPLFGLTGASGYLFKPMAEAVMIAMVASFLLSRTLVPTMAKYLLKARQEAHA